MKKMLIHWLLSALAIGIVAKLVPGFTIAGIGAALMAALAIGFINATLGLVLKIITFPLTLLTLGLFWFVINGAIIELASGFIPGFHVENFTAAFCGAIVLSLVNMLLKHLIEPEAEEIL